MIRNFVFRQDDEGEKPKDSAALAAALEARYGSAQKALGVLVRENWKLRQKNRDTAAKVPADGSVVLTAEQKPLWEAFAALNLKPDELKKKLEDHETLQNENRELKLGQAGRDAAESLNYRTSVLVDLIKTKGLTVEMRQVEVEEDGEKVKKSVPYAKGPGAEAKAEPLKDLVERDLKDYLPALVVKGSEEQEIVYPEQKGKGKAPSNDVVGQALGGIYVAPSKRKTDK